MPSATDVYIPFGDITLAGTLHTPDSRSPYPAVVMLAGSGPDDRDSGAYFMPIREAMINAGLAVLSWDKPGVGESTGDWHEQTFHDRANEAQTALAWLRERDAIDARRTDVWGHSQGGWVAQMVAAEDPKLAFAVMNSSPGVDVLAQDLYGVEHVLRRRGASDADIQQGIAYMEQVHAAAQAALPYEQFVVQVMEPARDIPGFGYFGEVGTGLWQFFVRNLGDPYDPAQALARITCPLLAIFGEQDDLVPVAESIRIYEAALGYNDDITIRVFPNADHRISTGAPPALDEGYLETLTSWLRARVR